MQSNKIGVCIDDALSHYGFGDDHPFSNHRYFAFVDELARRDLMYQVYPFETQLSDDEHLVLFHDKAYINRIKNASLTGEGVLDECGDTPVYIGIYEDGLRVVGSVVKATHAMMKGEYKRIFIPIAGLHHAMPDKTAGFCIFNDVGIAINVLKNDYNLTKIAYVDIDAHHGDGLYYPFEADETVIFADIHEDGRYVFPRTGFDHEIGIGKAEGKKINRALVPLNGDTEFFVHWQEILAFLHEQKPEFIFFQAGCDGISGDPLAHLHYSLKVHEQVTKDLCEIADLYAGGKLIAVGGGGYNLHNLARAWGSVVNQLLES